MTITDQVIAKFQELVPLLGGDMVQKHLDVKGATFNGVPVTYRQFFSQQINALHILIDARFS